MRYTRILGTLIAMGLAGTAAFAQNTPQPQDGTPPKAPAHEYPGLIQGDDRTGDQTNQAGGMNPDQSSLTGAESFSLGTPELGHSYWVPGLTFVNSAQSPLAGSSDWISSSYFMGDLSINVPSRNSLFALNYSGGGSVTNSSSIPSSYYHLLNGTQSFSFGRWKLTLIDALSYLPTSSFGFGGLSGLSLPGVGGVLGAGAAQFQPGFAPGQNLFTSNGPRINNNGAVEIDYSLTARSSLTAVGSYGILHFTEGNGIDTDSTLGSLGYNYQLTPSDTIGVVYRFSEFRYQGSPQAVEDHMVNLAYGRRITGKLAMRLFGGPEISDYRQPVTATSQRFSYSAGGSVDYNFNPSSISVTYNHGLYGGSGVLIGAQTDSVAFGITRPLTRGWSVRSQIGYTRNESVATSTSSQTWNSLFGSAGFQKDLSHTATLSISYSYYYQTINAGVCSLGGCLTNYKQHQIWLALHWHARPFVIR